MVAGCSGKPLAEKLGIKEKHRVYTKNAPEKYRNILGPVPGGVVFIKRLSNEMDMIHLFGTSRTELKILLERYSKKMKQNGMIWVSWPKKALNVSTDITEDGMRKIALSLGLIDIKVCAVDEVWSGLKLVIRKVNRA